MSSRSKLERVHSALAQIVGEMALIIVSGRGLSKRIILIWISRLEKSISELKNISEDN